MRCSICFAFFGLKAACGWLRVVSTVAVELNELEVSNDVVELFCGDFGAPGRLFCNLLAPLASFVGLLGDLLFTTSLRYLSFVFVRTDNGGMTPGAETWLKRFAISLTDPGGRDDGKSTGLDRTLFKLLPPMLD